MSGDDGQARPPAGYASEHRVASAPGVDADGGAVALHPRMPLEPVASLRDADDQLRRTPTSLQERRGDERLREAAGPGPETAAGDLDEPGYASLVMGIVLGSAATRRRSGRGESEHAPESDESQTGAHGRQQEQGAREERPVASREARGAAQHTS